MNYLWWALQVLLALAFVTAGYSHSFGYEATSERRGQEWMKALPANLVRSIGILEILGSIGLVIPGLTGILPWLTPVAATLLGVIVVLALGFHVLRREPPNAVLNVILALLAFAVAYGRFVASPF